MTTTRRIAAALALILGVATALTVPAASTIAAPPGDDEVIAFEVRGVGDGAPSIPWPPWMHTQHV